MGLAVIKSTSLQIGMYNVIYVRVYIQLNVTFLKKNSIHNKMYANWFLFIMLIQSIYEQYKEFFLIIIINSLKIHMWHMTNLRIVKRNGRKYA